ncbi:uncharacterized protein LOC144884731 [Branchiostoma floridae x Branchiostoma japonicum]
MIKSREMITMATPSSFKDMVKPMEWDIMGKITLSTLDLSNKNLNKFPNELLEMNDLEALDLSRNRNMDLSNELIKLTNLTLLNFEECHLDTVPAVVMELPQLQTLILSNNRNITLPDEMASLVNLTALDLEYCNLRTVPGVVMKLPQLQTLILRNNRNITLPDEMSSLVNLTVLYLNRCNLDTLPPVVLKLLKLQKLNLSGNPKLTSLPDELCKLKKINVLELRNCNLDTVPPAVLKLTQLEELNLSGNWGIHLPDELSGLTNIRVLKLVGTHMETVPPVVWKLTQLERLDLLSNPLQTLPPEVGQLTNVKHLDLSHCKLHTLPRDVGRLTQLEWLDLSNNPLQTLPAGVGQLTNVKHLDLSHCELDTLPRGVGRLTQLEWLCLRNNPLQTLPGEVGQLTKLKHFDLSECQLGTLPPEVWRITQLEWLDMSSNPLQMLPVEVGQLNNVKHLDLSDCQLRTLPPEMGRLAQLEWLELSWNQLQTLPAEVGQLTHVKHLDLSHCQLSTLPPELGRLTRLEWLILRFNPLHTLPTEFGQLTNVKVLELPNCQLRTLPAEVGRLTQLERLILKGNRLQTLPAEVGKLTNLLHLNVNRNSLTKPPSAVCGQGITAIRQYFEELERSEEKVSARLKVVVLGEKMAGKTSLVQTLRRGESSLTEEEDRTHCVEITQWEPDDNITFEVYDFGGHDVYHLTHQLFLTHDALNLLTVNLQSYNCTEQMYTEAVGFWLDTLNTRVPGAMVTIVGSKTDKCSNAEIEEKIMDIRKRYEKQQQSWKRSLEWQIQKLGNDIDRNEVKRGQTELRKPLDHTQRLLEHPLRLIGMQCVSSVEPTSGLDALKSHLMESANNTSLFPILRRILPRTWVDFEEQIHDLRDKGTKKRHSSETKRSSDDDSSAVHLQSDKKPKWLTRTDCLQQGQLAGLTTDRLEPVLSYLQQVGTILRYTDIPELKGLVFHDPPALVEIFKNLFHHDTKALFATPGLQYANYTSVQLVGFEQDLRDCGLIRNDVLTCMFEPDISPDIVTALMQHFGLCFEVRAEDKTDPSKFTILYKIPWYLYKQMPKELMSVWPEDVPGEQEQLQLMCDIRGFCPRGLFQRFSVGIHPLVQDRTDWKDGVMAYRQDYPVLVCSNPVAKDTYITMATRGMPDQAGEMWGVVHPLLEVLVQLLQEWPGVLYSLHVTCAHCIKARLDNPHQYDLRDRTADDARDVRCPRVKRTASTSADLVYRPSRLSGSNQRCQGRQSSSSLRPEVLVPSGEHPVPQPRPQPKGSEVRILLITDEYGTSKGGISTINSQLGQILAKAKAIVYATALKVPQRDQEAADRDGVQLIGPDLLGKKDEPTLDWLTFYHTVHYPNLPQDVSCIIGHADITDTAARNIKDNRYPEADLMTFNHVLPEDTEYYKGGRKAMKAWEKEKDMLDKSDNAKAAFSVGKRIYDHYDTMYKGEKKPKNHHIFLPKPSKIFLDATVIPGGEQKVVLCIGRVRKVEKLKGHDLVAQSMRDVVKVIKNVRLRVRGISEDDWETSLKILEENMNSPDLNPTLLPYGTQEDIRDDMMTAHLVLMPSRSEPFGLVGLEAIAAGIPVLISDKTGLAGMILDLIEQEKLSAEHRHIIVETSVNDFDRAGDAKRWADRIVDILKHSDSEFAKAGRLKWELEESRYWEESHRTFLQACGIPAGAAGL